MFPLPDALKMMRPTSFFIFVCGVGVGYICLKWFYPQIHFFFKIQQNVSIHGITKLTEIF